MGAPPNLPEGEEKHIEYSHLTPLSQLFLPSGRLGGGLLIASPPSCGGRESFFLLPFGEVGRGSGADKSYLHPSAPDLNH